MKLEETTLIMGKFSLAFPNFTLSAPAIKLWHELFQDRSAEVFNAAVRSLVMEPNRTFFPSVGEVKKVMDTLERGPLPTGAEIWALLCTQAQRGRTEREVMEVLATNNAAKSALRQVGWETIRTSNIETELPWRKREFIKYYEDGITQLEEVDRMQISNDQSQKLLDSLTKKLSR